MPTWQSKRQRGGERGWGPTKRLQRTPEPIDHKHGRLCTGRQALQSVKVCAAVKARGGHGQNGRTNSYTSASLVHEDRSLVRECPLGAYMAVGLTDDTQPMEPGAPYWPAVE